MVTTASKTRRSFLGVASAVAGTVAGGLPVIAQAALDVEPGDSAETLARRVHALEHRLYPAVIGWLAAGRLRCPDGQPELDGIPLTTPLRLSAPA